MSLSKSEEEEELEKFKEELILSLREVFEDHFLKKKEGEGSQDLLSSYGVSQRQQ